MFNFRRFLKKYSHKEVLNKEVVSYLNFLNFSKFVRSYNVNVLTCIMVE